MTVELGWFLEIEMSKQSEAKEFQMYVEKVIQMTCSNCDHCEPVMGERLEYIDPRRSSLGTHMAMVQTGQKCGIGEFAVKKLATCNLHVCAAPNAQ